jgi:hypothetical protein
VGARPSVVLYLFLPDDLAKNLRPVGPSASAAENVLEADCGMPVGSDAEDDDED